MPSRNLYLVLENRLHYLSPPGFSGDEAAAKIANQEMVNASEAIGEESARLVMAQEYPDFEELR